MTQEDEKPVHWIGDSKKQITRFPAKVKRHIGYALYDAQRGLMPLNGKPLKGFGGAGTVELVENYAGDTYRAVYTVRFKAAVYVLHAFQKKSKKGIAMPPVDIELIRVRLSRAQMEHEKWLERNAPKTP